MAMGMITKKISAIFCITLLQFCMGTEAQSNAAEIKLSNAEAQKVGMRIWKNECNGTVQGLTSWNNGENFASLGINHYIWYPEGVTGPFEESFPQLLNFLEKQNLQAHHVAIPAWVNETRSRGCPWHSRASFQQDLQGPRLTTMRQWLSNPDMIILQAQFSANRLANALPKMLATLPPAEQSKIRKQFYRVANSADGMFALIDYVNFKGDGTLPTERYEGKGWGLLQVLANMPGDGSAPSGRQAVQEFSKSAAQVLTQRVANAPKDKEESRWLPGWKNRVMSY